MPSDNCSCEQAYFNLIKPGACKVCNETFTSALSLNPHKQYHSSSCLSECELCDSPHSMTPHSELHFSPNHSSSSSFDQYLKNKPSFIHQLDGNDTLDSLTTLQRLVDTSLPSTDHYYHSSLFLILHLSLKFPASLKSMKFTRY